MGLKAGQVAYLPTTFPGSIQLEHKLLPISQKPKVFQLNELDGLIDESLDGCVLLDLDLKDKWFFVDLCVKGDIVAGGEGFDESKLGDGLGVAH